MSRPVNTILTSWEAKIMNIVWEYGRVTAVEIQEALKKEGSERSNSAIRKTLRALETKGYLQHKKEDRSYKYFTKYTKTKAEYDGIQYIRDLFFNGSSTELMMRIIDEEDITPELIQQMKNKLKKDE